MRLTGGMRSLRGWVEAMDARCRSLLTLSSHGMGAWPPSCVTSGP
jgi:hypothetical protein